jgi:hypothetical protein
MRHSQRPVSQRGHVEPTVLVPYPVFAGVHLQGTIVPVHPCRGLEYPNSSLVIRQAAQLPEGTRFDR